MDDRTQYLLTAEPLPLLVKLATPNTFAFFIQASVSLAEVWFIGQLGTASLAAIALAFPLLMLTQMMSGGAIGGAVASAVARALGAGDVNRANQLIWHAIAVAFSGAFLFWLAFRLGGPQFLHFLGGKNKILELSIAYCQVLFAGGIAIWLMGTISAVYRGTGNMQFPAMLMIVNAVVQVPLSGCLVLGAFGMPQLGIVGAAVSAVTSASIIATIMILRLIMGNVIVSLTVGACRFSRALFRDIFKVAGPASLSPFLTVTTILSLTAIVGRFGEAALAGYGIGSRIEFLLVPLIFGLGAAMTSLVGLNIGAGHIERAERIGWTGGIAAAVVAGTAGMLMALAPELWIPLFTSNPETFESARDYIQMVGPCFAFNGIGLSLYFASQGAGTMFWPVLATILRIIVAVGGALLLAFHFDYGLQGVFAAAATAMVLYGMLIATSLKLGAWRQANP